MSRKRNLFARLSENLEQPRLTWPRRIVEEHCLGVLELARELGLAFLTQGVAVHRDNSQWVALKLFWREDLENVLESRPLQ